VAGGGNAPQQLVRAGPSTVLLVVEDAPAVHQNNQISRAAGLDGGLDSQLLFSGFSQANGRAAQVQSKEATPDLDFHKPPWVVSNK
jgi:hypothetical protein